MSRILSSSGQLIAERTDSTASSRHGWMWDSRGRGKIRFHSSWLTIATVFLVVGLAGCTRGSGEEAREAIQAYCEAVDITGGGLGELLTVFKTGEGDPTAPAHNIATVLSDQVDSASRDLPLEDEAVVVSNQVNTQMWRLYADRLERDPKDRDSLIALASLVGNGQGACDTWRNIHQIPRDK